MNISSQETKTTTKQFKFKSSFTIFWEREKLIDNYKNWEWIKKIDCKVETVEIDIAWHENKTVKFTWCEEPVLFVLHIQKIQQNMVGGTKQQICW